jgi:hypothetical protein
MQVSIRPGSADASPAFKRPDPKGLLANRRGRMLLWRKPLGI